MLAQIILFLPYFWENSHLERGGGKSELGVCNICTHYLHLPCLRKVKMEREEMNGISEEEGGGHSRRCKIRSKSFEEG